MNLRIPPSDEATLRRYAKLLGISPQSVVKAIGLGAALRLARQGQTSPTTALAKYHHTLAKLTTL